MTKSIIRDAIIELAEAHTTFRYEGGTSSDLAAKAKRLRAAKTHSASNYIQIGSWKASNFGKTQREK
jgi:hypothetical protein